MTRVVQVAVPGILPMVLSHDGHGRLETVTQGMRTMTRGYWPDGYLATVTGPLNQVATYTPDLVGRVEEVLRPDGETVLYNTQFDFTKCYNECLAEHGC